MNSHCISSIDRAMGICAASDETVSSSDMIDQMLDVNSTYDVVIVCTSSAQMEDYWQDRLDRGRGQVMRLRGPRELTCVVEVCGKDTTVLVVHEDWEGGAGNGLGSLYAFQKAQVGSRLIDACVTRLVRPRPLQLGTATCCRSCRMGGSLW